MGIAGDSEASQALAQLATARYAPESSLPPPPRPFRPGAETLSVLTSLAELRVAVLETAATAQRLISIYSPDFEPEIYEQTPFLELVKRFVLTRSFAKVRLLVADGSRMREFSRFLAMAKRLSACIDLRFIPARAEKPRRAPAFLIADDRATVYRLRRESWDAVADINNPPVARLYLQEFEVFWAAHAVDYGLRREKRA